jgi:hypothetical protein
MKRLVTRNKPILAKKKKRDMGGYNFKNKSYFLTFPRAFETNTLGYEL